VTARERRSHDVRARAELGPARSMTTLIVFEIRI
jgi:hypothetical protein